MCLDNACYGPYLHSGLAKLITLSSSLLELVHELSVVPNREEILEVLQYDLNDLLDLGF